MKVANSPDENCSDMEVTGIYYVRWVLQVNGLTFGVLPQPRWHWMGSSFVTVFIGVVRCIFTATLEDDLIARMTSLTQDMDSSHDSRMSLATL